MHKSWFHDLTADQFSDNNRSASKKKQELSSSDSSAMGNQGVMCKNSLERLSRLSQIKGNHFLLMYSALKGHQVTSMHLQIWPGALVIQYTKYSKGKSRVSARVVPIIISASAISAYRHFFPISVIGKQFPCRYCRYYNIGNLSQYRQGMTNIKHIILSNRWYLTPMLSIYRDAETIDASLNCNWCVFATFDTYFEHADY